MEDKKETVETKTTDEKEEQLTLPDVEKETKKEPETTSEKKEPEQAKENSLSTSYIDDKFSKMESTITDMLKQIEKKIIQANRTNATSKESDDELEGVIAI